MNGVWTIFREIAKSRCIRDFVEKPLNFERRIKRISESFFERDRTTVYAIRTWNDIIRAPTLIIIGLITVSGLCPKSFLGTLVWMCVQRESRLSVHYRSEFLKMPSVYCLHRRGRILYARVHFSFVHVKINGFYIK